MAITVEEKQLECLYGLYGRSSPGIFPEQFHLWGNISMVTMAKNITLW